MTRAGGVVVAAIACGIALASGGLLAGCPDVPPAEQLSVSGKIEREGVLGTDLEDKTIAYASKSARGEWWSCELRMTAGACVDDKHVNVWLALPGVTTLGDLGGAGCVDGDGNPFGVFEVLTEKLTNGDPVEIPTDVQAFVLVASDKNDSGGADLQSDDETFAATRYLSGLVEVDSLGSFTDPVSLKISGLTASDSLELAVEMNGPTTPVPNPPKLDVARTCVADDVVE